MSVERAIHRRWSSYKPLVGIIPLDHIHTGWQPPEEDDNVQTPTLPFVALTRQGTTDVRHPSGDVTIELAVLRFSVWTALLDQGKRVMLLVRRRFDTATFDYDGGRVLDCRQVNDLEIRQQDGAWNLQLDYQFRTQEPL